jgi:hypothetical protein
MSNDSTEKEELESSLEKQLVAVSWVKAIVQILEYVLLSKLYSINGDKDLPSTKEIIKGVGIQTLGQLSVAVGASQQIAATDKAELIEIQKFLIMSDWIQSFGSAVEAMGQTKVVMEELEDGVTFLP